MKIAFLVGLLSFLCSSIAQEYSQLFGHWKGIQMFQDENSYDGQTIYLPNSDYLSITQEKMGIYFYPYFKSDEFKIEVKGNEIRYTINGKRVESEFHLKNDTLVLTMYFIKKRFIKMYEKTSLDSEILQELDQYGFNPSSLTNEFELDTFHNDYKIGFRHYNELYFNPVQTIQFLNDEQIVINRGKAISFSRGYHTIRFKFDGKDNQFTIAHSEGTQRLGIIPTSDCKCDSLVIPYIASSWGNRIRQSIIDFEKF